MKTFTDEGITFFTDDTFFIVATGMKWVSYTNINLVLWILHKLPGFTRMLEGQMKASAPSVIHALTEHHRFLFIDKHCSQ